MKKTKIRKIFKISKFCFGMKFRVKLDQISGIHIFASFFARKSWNIMKKSKIRKIFVISKFLICMKFRVEIRPNFGNPHLSRPSGALSFSPVCQRSQFRGRYGVRKSGFKCSLAAKFRCEATEMAPELCSIMEYSSSPIDNTIGFRCRPSRS